MAVVGSDSGIRRLTVPQPGADKALNLISEFISQSSPNSAYFNELVYRMQLYFEGERVDFTDKLDLRNGTPFQLDVWNAVRKIPYGKVRTYGEIAQEIGRPGSARGVGQALGRNPLPIIIPCHRVIGANGVLGGYTGGVETKQKLLKLESSHR